MAVGDVIAQKNGASSMEELTTALKNSEAASSADEAASTATVANIESPTLTFRANGTEYTLSTQTLILYGVALADILLLYIATRM